MHSKPPNAQKVRLFWWLLIPIALIAISRLQTLHEPLERDITTYAVLAHEMSQGKTLYSELVENKPPGIFLVFYVAERVLGYGDLQIYALGVFAAWLTLLGICFASLKITKSPALSLWASLFWCVVSRDLLLQANQPNTEVFINACIIWAFYFSLNIPCYPFSRYLPTLLTGFFVGLGSLFKTVAALYAVFFSIGVWISIHQNGGSWKKSVPHVFLLHTVVLLLWAMTAGYFWTMGRLGDFYDVVFRYNAFYAGNVLVNILVSFKPEFLSPFFLAPLLPLFVALLLFVPGIRKDRLKIPGEILLLCYLAASHLVMAMPGKFYAHYYQYWLPVLCVAGVTAIHRLASVKRQRVALGLIFLALLGLQIPNYFRTPNEWAVRKYGNLLGGMMVRERAIGNVIAQLLRPEETFYEWGNQPALYYYSGKSHPTGVPFKWHMTNPPLRAKLSERTLSIFANRPPELWVTTEEDPWRGATDHPVYLWFQDRYSPFELPELRLPFRFYYRRGGQLENRLLGKIHS